MNFIILISSYLTPTYPSDIACYGNYEVHSDKRFENIGGHDDVKRDESITRTN